MIHQWYSNALEELVQVLLDRIRPADATDLTTRFSPVTIIVPNRNLETYLTLEIARTRGIAANLTFDFWERFLARDLEGTDPPTRLLHQDMLHAALLLRFEQGSDLPEAVVRYLESAPDAPGSRERQAFQLAQRVAALFEEYALSRRAMIRDWDRHPDRAVSETEAWQRTLWSDLFGGGGWRESLESTTGARWIRFDELLERETPSGSSPPRTLHLFGFSYIAPLYQDLLVRMAASSTIHLYGFQPGPLLEDEEIPTADIYHPMFRAWGTPGREYMELMSSRPQVERHPIFVQPDGDRPVGATAELSVQACPSRRREAEMISNEIWSVMGVTGGEGPAWAEDMRFNEIAVIIADSQDREAYQTHLTAAFEENHRIPVNLIDTAPSSDSRILEAVHRLLALPRSGFKRPDVLRILTHPALQNRIPDATPDAWVRWCDQAHVYWGRDRTDQAGTYLEHDRFNWDQGLRRVALGAYMDPAGPVNGTGLPWGQETYVPVPVESGRESDAARLVHLVRELIDGSRELVGRRASLTDWGGILGDWLARFIAPRTPADDRLWTQILSILDEMGDLDPTGTALGFDHAAGFLATRLEGLTGDRGTYLTDGVVISSFLPMRPIPFKLVFIVGLGEGRFPATRPPEDLDLTRRTREIGDVSETDRDRYLFLETLVATRHRVVLSYVAREASTGDDLEPSPLIDEIETWSTTAGSPDEHAHEGSIEGRHPLRRYHPVYFAHDPGEGLPSFVDRARAEFEVRHGVRPDPEEDLEDAVRAVRHLRGLPLEAQERLDLLPLPETSTEDPTRGYEISLSALRRFLQCPLQGWATMRLGLSDEEADRAARLEDEPFDLDRRTTAGMLAEILLGLGAIDFDPDPDEITRVADALWTPLEQSGESPTGLFGRLARKDLVDLVTHWSRQLEARGLGGRGGLDRWFLGRGPEDLDPRNRLDALVIPLDGPDGAPIPVRIHGATGILTRDMGLAIKPTTSPRATVTHHIGPLLDWHVLNALGHCPSTGSPTFESLALQRDGQSLGKNQRRLATWTNPDRSRQWLAAVLEDLFTKTHDYYLPIEAVLAIHAAPDQDPTEVVEEVRAKESDSSRYGPIGDARTYPTPDPETIARILDRRYAPVLDVEVPR